MRPRCTVSRGLLGTFTAAAGAIVFLSPVAAAAQTTAEDWCRDVERDRYCEVRHLTAPASAGDLTIDVGPNGGVQVEGYSGSDVRVTARVVGRARNARAARELTQDVQVRLSAGELRATGPRTSGRDGWSVSVRVQVPVGTAISAQTTNGSITVNTTNAPVQARTTNGSIRLADVAGRIDARSTNGTIRASFARGAESLDGVQLRTTNGSVHLALPEGVSARIELATTNGSIHTELPISVQGRVSRRQLSGVLGTGGPEIRATTTNGSIRLTTL